MRRIPFSGNGTRCQIDRATVPAAVVGELAAKRADGEGVDAHPDLQPAAELRDFVPVVWSAPGTAACPACRQRRRPGPRRCHVHAARTPGVLPIPVGTRMSRVRGSVAAASRRSQPYGGSPVPVIRANHASNSVNVENRSLLSDAILQASPIRTRACTLLDTPRRHLLPHVCQPRSDQMVITARPDRARATCTGMAAPVSTSSTTTSTLRHGPTSANTDRSVAPVGLPRRWPQPARPVSRDVRGGARICPMVRSGH